ncbi:D-sedoheptulose 7-phosphate isomerase [Lachnospiraceae bacterium RM5]|nr:D-sedoheptulose 7-phosphate isomerase [Lachnospiraceae bacterium RM5]
MKDEKEIIEIVNELILRYPVLEKDFDSIIEAYECLKKSYLSGGKLLLAGNGGSAADCEHISGELMKSFKIPRKIELNFSKKLVDIDEKIGQDLSEKLEKGLVTIPLVSNKALITAYINDVGADNIFAQQLFVLGEKNDVFLAISTSGNSENIIRTVVTAKAIGMKVIGLTGKDGGRLAKMSDISIIAPEMDTFKIQELHLPIYHCLCMMLEKYFFG